VVCDSVYGDGGYFRLVREKFGPLRTAILPIGAYEPREFMRDVHMNPADAVKALEDCGADVALAHHHGTFQLTDEAIDAPASDLAFALDTAKQHSLDASRHLVSPARVIRLISARKHPAQF
jgi:L-ascorbate metabolism protein UlaG (beta-lactamase superfamily)